MRIGKQIGRHVAPLILVSMFGALLLPAGPTSAQSPGPRACEAARRQGVTLRGCAQPRSGTPLPAQPRTSRTPRQTPPVTRSRPPAAPQSISPPGLILQCNTRGGTDPFTRRPDRWWFRIDEQNQRWEIWRQSDPRWVSVPCNVPETGFANICFFRPAEFRYQNATTRRLPEGEIRIRTDYIVNRLTGDFTVTLNDREAAGTCERSEPPTPPRTRF